MDQRITPPAFAKSRRQGEGSDIKRGLLANDDQPIADNIVPNRTGE